MKLAIFETTLVGFAVESQGVQSFIEETNRESEGEGFLGVFVVDMRKAGRGDRRAPSAVDLYKIGAGPVEVDICQMVYGSGSVVVDMCTIVCGSGPLVAVACEVVCKMGRDDGTDNIGACDVATPAG